MLWFCRSVDEYGDTNEDEDCNDSSERSGSDYRSDCEVVVKARRKIRVGRTKNRMGMYVFCLQRTRQNANIQIFISLSPS